MLMSRYKCTACSRILSFPIASLHRTIVVFLCVVSLLSIMAAVSTADTQAAALTAVSDSSLKFTNSLYKVLSEQEGNIFFSPVSIEVILALTYMGAKANTALQMASGLHLPADQEVVKQGFNALMTSLKGDDKVTLEIANTIFTEQTLQVFQDFFATAEKHFKADVEAVNFVEKWAEARLLINQWVEGKTNNKIKDLIAEGVLSKDTAMVLVNAIYFKGDWANKFDTANTFDEPFHLSANESKTVKMMHIKKKFGYAQREDLDCKILEMPYVGDKLSLFVFLPNQVDGLKTLEAKLQEVNLKEVINGMDHVEVEVALPKFKLEQTIDLKAVLQKLGMVDMFEANADFTGISDKPMCVSKVIHKAFIEVNEEGSEAAAATAVHMCFYSLSLHPPRINVFKADHPFMFAVHDNQSGASVFVGRFARPQ